MDDEIIRLNVGGRLMTTTRSTLTKYGDSLLGKMFDAGSQLPPARLVDGAYFMDEDPEIFEVILNWLRHGTVDYKTASKDHLKAVASYFGLLDLEELLDKYDSWTEDIIRLNVGGRFMTTTRQTLTNYAESALSEMFSSDSQNPPMRLPDGAYFIDVDPDVFTVILNWLRLGVVDCGSASKEHVKAAASHFGLTMLEIPDDVDVNHEILGTNKNGQISKVINLTRPKSTVIHVFEDKRF